MADAQTLTRAQRRRLPKAKLLQIEWSTGASYFARFRLANALRWQIGRLTITHRAPWLAHVARAHHPHLFRDGDAT